ncbi:hypothetical protein ACES2I_02050 [Bdellovibrio bacteriovorus]|uniref:hypothetical protein n=1 Tax=Bdellovibrio bacteriovorus TaxID=959 RepID=UPI0035A5F9AA
MKKLITGALVGLALVSSTAHAQLCNPITRPAGGLVPPVVVKERLKELRQELGDRKVEEILGKPVLVSLDKYSEMDPTGINANAYAAAAAAGAAAAVVEYVWDRYVGNGPGDRYIQEEYFDIRAGTLPNHITQVVNPKVVLVAGGKDIGPVALTPAAVGTAVAGAVAYKAAEYSMRKVFGDPNKDVRQYDERDFDIQRNYQN